MENWSVLVEVLILLATALVLGTLAETLKQSAIVGYLVAGAIVGPNVLGWVHSEAGVRTIAELGIALLLFTIGLEFSFRRLRGLGPQALVGGTLQIVITCLVVMLVGVSFHEGLGTSFVLGAMIALSSTATVLRLLADHAALESPYGRNALGILLLQDAAVVPLALVISAMGTGGRMIDAAWTLARTFLFASVLVMGFLILFNYVVPRILNLRQLTRNREFGILLAIVLAIGSAVAAQRLSISPALGAFLAGVLLAESPFAVQIRADVVPLKTVLVTLFFASVGMLSDPAWVGHHWALVLGVVAALLVGKTAIVWTILRPLHMPHGIALATGLCVAQVGEFAFVLPQTARGSLLDPQAMPLMVSVALITLFLTPYLVGVAPPLAGWVEGRLQHRRVTLPPLPEARAEGAPAPAPPQPLIIIIGFGPAGQRVAEDLLAHGHQRTLVLDLNPRSAAIAQRYGLTMQVGDSRQPEVLESAGIHQAGIVIITVPDPAAGRQIIDLCRQMNPDAIVLVRARYHAFRWELQLAGAEVVVDEEEQLGLRLAAEVRRILHGRP